ncbi:hypothetical protein [Halogeometricum limi]|uniref:Uncharacterized protein n=1 Tax=Halogeometricum limi TaxID=555875 RepID=A0A1I6I2C5_9EURY|nr:hypothetical protein [Halogeometricum limi]SFR60845.1 hypothetical protein SAMN04488124_2724 [Halogeometricum limi]
MSLLETIRRPDYTGSQRCWPCTAVNAALLVLLAGVLLLFSPFLAVVTLVGGATLVYLRGYVVPGTPDFAPELVSRLGLAFLFEHTGTDTEDARRSDELGDAGDDDAPDGEAVLYALFEAGVLEDDETGALFLADSFWSAWADEMATLRAADDETVAEATADVAPFDAEGGTGYGGITVDGGTHSIWLSRAHAVSDAAAMRTMDAFDVPESMRAPATEPLRMFLETCPLCGGDTEETTVSGCCGGTASIYDSPTDEVLACADCGEILYVYEDETA